MDVPPRFMIPSKQQTEKKLLWLIIPSILIQSNEIKFATIKSSDPEAEMISQ